MSFLAKYLTCGKGSVSGIIRLSALGASVRPFCPPLASAALHYRSAAVDPSGAGCLFVPGTVGRRKDLSDDRVPLLYSESELPWSLTQRRYRWRHKLVRQPYTKVVTFDSGDQTMFMGAVDAKAPKLGFEDVEELKDVDDTVKKIFSLEFATGCAVSEKLVHDLVAEVKDHALDDDSLEVKIARDTVRIRNGIKHCVVFRHDKLTKTTLVKRIARRRTMLRELKSKDIDKFNWIVSELKLTYADPTKYDNRKLSRKGVRKKVARDAAIALKKKKMDEFQKVLNREKAVFAKFRDNELAKIEAELRELGIDEMKSTAETLEALGMGDLMPKPEPRISRRRLLLQTKFKLFGEQKKIKDDAILKANGFLTDKEMPYLP